MNKKIDKDLQINLLKFEISYKDKKIDELQKRIDIVLKHIEKYKNQKIVISPSALGVVTFGDLLVLKDIEFYLKGEE